MITQDMDEYDSKGIPLLAEPLFNFYPHDALDFQLGCFTKTIDFLKELYPNKNTVEYEKMTQILKVEMISKFCHYAENLGSISIGFNKKFDDFTEEITNTFSYFLEYSVNDIVKFFKSVDTMNDSEVSRILGYPILEIQHPDTRKVLLHSCQNAREKFIRIAELYLELRQFYNAYKHGYRILLSKSNETQLDIFPYYYKEGGKIKQRFIEADKAFLQKILRGAIDCSELLEYIFWHHRYRVNKESEEIETYNIQIKFFLKKGQEIKFPKNRVIIFKTRGQTDRVRKELASKVYSKFARDLERNHKGEYLVLDLDKETIVAFGPDINRVAEKAHDYQAENNCRINYRIIGKDGDFNFSTY